MQLLGRVACYHLDLGPIPDTVELVETLLTEKSIESPRPLANSEEIDTAHEITEARRASARAQATPTV